MRPRPRSLRARLVLGTTLLATLAVLLCQAAGLTVLHGWLTDQVDGRLTRFRLMPDAEREAAQGVAVRAAREQDVLPSDYRVYFYHRDGHRLAASLGGEGDGERDAGPSLPATESSLDLPDGRPRTVEAADGDGRWRVIARDGHDGMRVVVALPLREVDGATMKMLWFSLVVGVAVAVCVVASGRFFVTLGLRPLTRVERTARRIADGESQLRIADGHAFTEVAHLSHALNSMLDRLRAALQRSEASEQRLRRFLADAGHELRTPLTSLQGFAELLVDAPGMDADRRDEAHRLIVQNAGRMSRLVDDLIQLAQLSEAPVAHREQVDLLSLAADTIAALAVQHPGRRIGLGALDDADDAPGSGELDVVQTVGDPHQLAQILTNLLANACTHTPPGTAVRVRVGGLRVRARGPGRDLPHRTSANPPLDVGSRVGVVEVADDGPGLAAPDATRILERLYRTRTTPPDGTRTGFGLGLAIASGIAAAHGGRLELDTRPGRGCTFRLLLPHEPAQDPTPRPRELPPATPATADPSRRRSTP
ncbi:HAMP domain-containing sensor histidine kinase [Streptomyces sp. OS603R]|uniref:sensor histidine kinase n=1 Tax=Streptomyces sp. OS603R TaxID=3035287 RepID=UPI002434BA4A|nr:HAMP domain-containing sensor histidine kinase [Streptomyces sp. OS603R]